MKIDWEKLWRRVTADFACSPISVHGPTHWQRVEKNGLLISQRSGADTNVVRLFALFHDSRRRNDGWDTTHGAEGARYAGTLRGTLFDVTDDQFLLLQEACSLHTVGKLSGDPTIGTCWDADRLDLDRVGTTPSPSFMSTEFGREIARFGSIKDFHSLSG